MSRRADRRWRLQWFTTVLRRTGPLELWVARGPGHLVPAVLGAWFRRLRIGTFVLTRTRGELFATFVGRAAARSVRASWFVRRGRR
ncbi:hypothetical protein [Nocardia sp. NPDC052112]|uniref:hypothetical protein n=1 Tax=Nocardia sp. NPDC052112 TaxID=3155646 RepID=UPI0034214E69